ncbi:conserved hypothetical protein [Paraburkholderia phymatum STM815]|uniref:Transmembrane protein n=1 Tax=Paraburkholderia phymatum (strain DSM 17167 / CIP 108236 / LMG 21445 / STM815) TaxID=391038 RepID=B2JGV4_PARP8|nr:conserved hypothetical protein [Paraburkholderia phymatum STM815]
MSCGAVSPDGALKRAAPGFADIDWSRPWFAQVAARGVRWQQAALRGAAQQLREMNADAGSAVITTGRGKRLTFIPQDELPPGTAYEAHIAATGCVPTRHNLHDFFNALTWFQFPRIKAALSARGSAAVDALGIGPTRGDTRDALTVFDENAVLFACSDPALSTALQAFSWKTLFVAQRAAWDERCEVRCFGHALLEKLVTPYKACTGHAWIVEVPSAYFTWTRAARDSFLDDTVARVLLEGAGFSSQMFAPLPVLGIPGWWADNETESFYDDASVFRSGRRSRVAPDGKIAASKVGQAVAASLVSAGEGEESPDSTGQGDG